MDRKSLLDLLSQVAGGSLDPHQALERMKDLPYADLGFARLDLHRALRQGMPEVVFCPGKTDQQISEILERLSASHPLVLATRAGASTAAAVKAAIKTAQYEQEARIIRVGAFPEPRPKERVALLTAGTADIPVAEEAAVTLRAAGVSVEKYFDVGVAGIHRLLDQISDIRQCQATIVVAGMDGVLPSVVAGLLSGPVIAVPTSVGYGTVFGGVGPLLTMLNSCAAGLTVVNIDNGFGAAVAAIRALSAVRS